MHNLIPTTGFVNIGELFVCNCGIPLARKIGPSEYEFIKIHNNERVAMDVKLGDFTQVNCKKCRRGFAFVRVREKIGLVDNMKVTGSPSTGIVEK